MKLMTLQQYSKLSKASLIRKIVKTLKKMPKRKLAVLCYNLQKSRLPTFLQERRFEIPDTPEHSLMVAQFGEEGYSQMKVKERQKEARRLFKKPRSAKQRANDRRLARMAKARARRKRR